MKLLDPEIVSEDDSFFIVNKPSGWIVNEAATTKGQPVLQTWLKETKEFEISKSHEMRSGIVHRLDKETSGILIVAKTEHAFYTIQKQFKERIVKKTYKALLHGVPNPQEGEINVPVGRLPWRRDRFGVLPGGREAYTKYRVSKIYVHKDTSEKLAFVTVFPKTGRTHQIRIHMKHINHALVADEFYAGRKTARRDRKWCPRLFLHAASISFLHPEEEKEVSFDAPLTDDLNDALNLLTVFN